MGRLRRPVAIIALILSSFTISAYISPLSNISTIRPINIPDDYHAHLGQTLENVPTSVEDGVTSYIVGEHHEVRGEYPTDYVWVDSETRVPFEKVIHENGRTNSAIGRMPRASPYDALVLARGWNGQYTDEREDVPLRNLTVVG